MSILSFIDRQENLKSGIPIVRTWALGTHLRIALAFQLPAPALRRGLLAAAALSGWMIYNNSSFSDAADC